MVVGVVTLYYRFTVVALCCQRSTTTPQNVGQSPLTTYETESYHLINLKLRKRLFCQHLYFHYVLLQILTFYAELIGVRD